MKKQIKLFVTLVLIASIFTGCQKIIDKWFPGHHPQNPDPQGCRIKKVTQIIVEGADPRTGIFYYSYQGKLDSVIFDEGGGAARTYYWKYNNSGKLIGYQANYNSGDYYFIHKYVWSGGKIVQDSAWIAEAGEYAQVTDLEYDAQGRVIKESGKVYFADGVPVDSPIDDVLYSYNSDGNLVNDHLQDYDDKVSYFSTNQVLQFVHRNYSVNNPVGASGYNTEDLPLGFATKSNFFLQMSDPDTIEYDCPDDK